MVKKLVYTPVELSEKDDFRIYFQFLEKTATIEKKLRQLLLKCLHVAYTLYETMDSEFGLGSET